MKALVETIVKELVDNPSKVKVSEVVGEMGTIIEVKVQQEDRGKIIGKQGRIIDAIRRIAHSVSMKQGRRATVEIVE